MAGSAELDSRIELASMHSQKDLPKVRCDSPGAPTDAGLGSRIQLANLRANTGSIIGAKLSERRFATLSNLDICNIDVFITSYVPVVCGVSAPNWEEKHLEFLSWDTLS
jgi:hypothetical protein